MEKGMNKGTELYKGSKSHVLAHVVSFFNLNVHFGVY